MALTSVDYLEQRQKRTYKPEPSGLILRNPRGDRGRRLQGRAGIMGPRHASIRSDGGPIKMTSLDSFKCCKTLKVGTKTYAFHSLPEPAKNGLKGISRLPFSLKVLLENLLRNEDGRTVTKEDLLGVAQWLKTKTSEREIAFRPARVLMQDFTGVPAVVDLAAMRDAMKMLGGDP